MYVTKCGSATLFGLDVKPRSSLCSTPNMDLKYPKINKITSKKPKMFLSVLVIPERLLNDNVNNQMCATTRFNHTRDFPTWSSNIQTFMASNTIYSSYIYKSFNLLQNRKSTLTYFVLLPIWLWIFFYCETLFLFWQGLGNSYKILQTWDSLRCKVS